MRKINIHPGALALQLFSGVKKLAPIVLLGIVVACTRSDEETPGSFVRQISADTLELRKEIAAMLSKDETTMLFQSHPLVLPPKAGANAAAFDFGWVTEHGAIMVYSKKLSIVTVFEPHVGEGKITWKCTAYPEEAKPKECDSWKEEGKQPATAG